MSSKDSNTSHKSRALFLWHTWELLTLYDTGYKPASSHQVTVLTQTMFKIKYQCLPDTKLFSGLEFVWKSRWSWFSPHWVGARLKVRWVIVEHFQIVTQMLHEAYKTSRSPQTVNTQLTIPLCWVIKNILYRCVECTFLYPANDGAFMSY